MRISWPYLEDILAICWAYLGHILSIWYAKMQNFYWYGWLSSQYIWYIYIYVTFLTKIPNSTLYYILSSKYLIKRIGLGCSELNWAVLCYIVGYLGLKSDSGTKCLLGGCNSWDKIWVKHNVSEPSSHESVVPLVMLEKIVWKKYYSYYIYLSIIYDFLLVGVKETLLI